MGRAEPSVRRTHPRWGDGLFKAVAAAAAGTVVMVMAAIFLELADSSALAFDRFGFGFLASESWNPVTEKYGALSSIYGTLVSTFIAMLIAVPLSLVIALFLVELAPPAISRPVGAAIELLAAVPSIIYGMWGLFVVAPWMAKHVQPALSAWIPGPLFKGPPMGIGMLTAGLILALMVLPFIASVMRDVFRMVPPIVKEAGYGMGSTTWEVARQVTVRYGIKGMIGACFLGLGRAVGETMAVTFVIGNDHRIAVSLHAAGNTIASTLANEFAEAAEPLYQSSLVYLGLVLFTLTFLIQLATQAWLSRIERSAGAGL